jgi:ubiquitin C-terminal hydrolase
MTQKKYRIKKNHTKKKNKRSHKTKSQIGRSKNKVSNNKYVMNGGSICSLFTDKSGSSTSEKATSSATSSNAKSSAKSVIETILMKPIYSNIKYGPSHNPNNTLIYTGIANVGNTCYINATLQMLWSIPEIRAHIINLDRKYLVDHYYSNYKYEITFILSTLFNTFYSKSAKDTHFYGELTDEETNAKKTTNPALESLKSLNLSSIQKKKYIFNYSQQDAQEYLNALMNFLCDSDDFTKKCKFIDLNQYIQYEEESTTTCLYEAKPGEEKVSKKTDNSFILQLPLSETDPQNNISDLIKQYQSIEKLEENQYLTRCYETETNPGKQGPANKQILIKQPSNNLIIQLKRFKKLMDGDGNFLDSNKNKDSIIPNPTITIDSLNFKLQGCIIHSGGPKGGHYVYLVFNNDGKPSFIMDDWSIHKNFKTYNHLTDGYVYYYRRIEK